MLTPRRAGAGRSPSPRSRRLGGTVEDVVRTRQYITHADSADLVSEAHGEVFGAVRPASTMVIVAGLLDPRWLVEVELDAIVAG